MPSQQLPVKTLFSPHGLRDLPGELSCGNRCKSVAKKSPTWDKLGYVWDNIGVILDNIGTIPAQLGHTKTPKISIFSKKIKKIHFLLKIRVNQRKSVAKNCLCQPFRYNRQKSNTTKNFNETERTGRNR